MFSFLSLESVFDISDQSRLPSFEITKLTYFIGLFHSIVISARSSMWSQTQKMTFCLCRSIISWFVGYNYWHKICMRHFMILSLGWNCSRRNCSMLVENVWLPSIILPIFFQILSKYWMMTTLQPFWDYTGTRFISFR